MPLRPLQEPLAPQPARAQRDLRLDDVVAGPQRIALRVHERRDPRLLVVVQVAERILRRKRDWDRHRRDLPPPHPGRQEHRRADDRRDHPRPQVRLLQDQQHRHRHHDRGRHQEQRVAHLLPARLVEPGRQRHHQPDLGQLARLQLQPPDLDPALRPLPHMPDPQDQHQQRDRPAIDQPPHPRDQPDVHHGDAQHHHQPEAEADDVLLRVGLRAPPRRRIQRHIADAGQQAQQHNIGPADLPQLGGQPERRLGPDQPAGGDHDRTATRAPGGSVCPAGSRVSTSIMMSRPNGAAAAAPALPCSTTTATAYFGAS